MSDLFGVFRLEETEKSIGPDSEQPVAIVQQNDQLLTLLYTPKGEDLQPPHDNDEIYVVAQGRGTIEVDGAQEQLDVGDAVFVAAKAQHRFSEFSEDFAVWAVFPGAI